MMSRQEVYVVALTASTEHTDHFCLVLESPSLQRRVPIIIGQSEAQAIAMALEKMLPLRPQTHDLYCMSLEALGVSLREVSIASMEEGRYHALLLLEQAGKEVLVDARPSDAVALAVRVKCPLYMTTSLLEQEGLSQEDEQFDVDKKGSYAGYSIAELEDLLQKVLDKEDYKSAGRIRDAIEKRKSQP